MKNIEIEKDGQKTFLVYCSEDEKEFDTVTYGMMNNNTIEGILPMVYTQLNEKKYFKYLITGKKSLKEYLQDTMTKEKVISILLQLSKVFIETEAYMISVDQIVLDMNYIYIDNEKQTIGCICLPITPFGECNFVDFFKQIIFSMQLNYKEKNDYVTEIIMYLNRGEIFSLQEFKRMLENMATGHMQKETVPTPPKNEFSFSQNQRETPNSEKVYNRKDVVLEEQKEFKSNAPVLEKKEKKAEKKPKKRKSSMLPSNMQEIEIPNLNAKDAEEIQPQEQENDKKKNGFFGLFNTKEKENKKNKKEKIVREKASVQYVQNTVEKNPIISPEKMEAENRNYIEKISMEQEPDLDATVALSNEKRQEYMKSYLLRRRNQEKIILTKPIFKIGKDKDGVDYRISNNSAISRKHVCILEKGKEYYIVDMESKNHTFLNNLKIESNIEVPLKNHTIIRMADEEFEFVNNKIIEE